MAKKPSKSIKKCERLRNRTKKIKDWMEEISQIVTEEK
jgi:hypothetical protein